MIIKGLFRRYERWNPVHPTCGAFWGMGVGVGCGVGWGPGFGPEVVGYVGAGCGVGFSVGFTVAGFGIGLPVNYLFRIPYNAVVSQRNGALRFTQPNLAWDGWNDFASRISLLQRAADERIFSSKRNNFLEKRAELCEAKRKLSACVKSFPDVLKASFSRVFLPPGKV